MLATQSLMASLRGTHSCSVLNSTRLCLESEVPRLLRTRALRFP